MLHADCLTRTDQFIQLEPEWRKLWASSAGRSIFLTHDWFRLSWEEVKEGRELRVIVVRDGLRPVLAVPLMKSQIKCNGLPVHCLTFIEHPETQRADVLFDKDHQNAEVVAAFIRFLLTEQSGDWNLLSLDKLSPASPTISLVSEAASVCGRVFESRLSHSAAFIRLDQDWDAYLSSRSTRFRKTLRNITNRIKQLGPVQLKCYSGSDEATEAIANLCSVAHSSWKAANGIAITSQPSRVQFFSDLFSHQGSSLCVWILEAAGVPIASETQIIDERTVYAVRADYDERYSDQSPGSYLQIEILKRLFSSSYEKYDFGVGINPYKARWTENHESLVSWRMYNETLYSRILQSADKCERQVKQNPALRALHGFVLGRVS
jgi:CelD/BcsL family acetyltransferase involved in cellulose biosynthesis